jgi:hypothetical protein
MPVRPVRFFNVFNESSCQMFCITGYISAATHNLRNAGIDECTKGTVARLCKKTGYNAQYLGVVKHAPVTNILDLDIAMVLRLLANASLPPDDTVGRRIHRCGTMGSMLSRKMQP